MAATSVTGAARYGIDTEPPENARTPRSKRVTPWRGAKPKEFAGCESPRDSGACASSRCANVESLSSADDLGRLEMTRRTRGRLGAIRAEGRARLRGPSGTASRMTHQSTRVSSRGKTKRPRALARHRPLETIYASYLFGSFYAHSPVETMNCVADVRADRCIIWAPTQAPNSLQEEVAKFLGMAPEKSRKSM